MNPLSIASIAESIYGIFSGLNSNRQQKEAEQRQMEYSKELMDIQNQYNIAAMHESAGIQKGLYDYTFNKNTPAAKVRMLKNAGLNVGLMYSGGAGNIGGSTVTGSPTGNTVGPQSAPSVAGFEQAKIAKMGMALQLAKLRSEISVNESVAKANTATAEKTAGVDTQKAGQEIENLKTTREGQELLNYGKKIENTIANATSEDQIRRISYMADEANENLQILKNNHKISDATYETAINQTKAVYEKTLKEILQINTETRLSETQINKIFTEIKQKWTELGQNNQKMQIEIMRILYDNDAAMEREKLKAYSQLAPKLIPYLYGKMNKMYESLDESIKK